MRQQKRLLGFPLTLGILFLEMHPLLAAKQNFATNMLLKAILIGKDAPERDSIGKDPGAIAAE